MEHVVMILVEDWNKNREEPLTWKEVFNMLLALRYFPAAEWVAEVYLPNERV